MIHSDVWNFIMKFLSSDPFQGHHVVPNTVCYTYILLNLGCFEVTSYVEDEGGLLLTTKLQSCQLCSNFGSQRAKDKAWNHFFNFISRNFGKRSFPFPFICLYTWLSFNYFIQFTSFSGYRFLPWLLKSDSTSTYHFSKQNSNK